MLFDRRTHSLRQTYKHTLICSSHHHRLPAVTNDHTNNDNNDTMVAFLTTIAAFAAIASAVPHAHRHAHSHHARDVQVTPRDAVVESLAGRSISYDGSCGSWSGLICPAGSCCGPNGWCGNGTDFCGTGCQSGFGDCGASDAAPAGYSAPATNNNNAAAPSSAPSTSLKVSPNGLCGQDVGYTCQGSNFGDSCSKWNYCGSNSSYTGDGCQSQFGTCGESVAPAAGSSAAAASQYAASSSSASSAGDSLQTGINTKNPGGPPAYSAPAYSAPQTTLVTKTFLPSSSPAAATSAPAYSAPPAVSSAPPAYTSAPSSSAAAEPTSSASPSSYGSTGTDDAPPSTVTDGKHALEYVKEFHGDGSTANGWPSQSDWYSFDDLWVFNKPIMGTNCLNVFQVDNNNDDENKAIYKYIKEVSQSTGVDPRFMLAIMMQESNGCVRVHTTSYSHDNPGLFQSHEGTGSCNPKGGSPQSPCPDDQIKQMIEDGVAGTSSGDGLKQVLASCSSQGAQAYYEAARKYNSGSIASDGNLGQGVATHCYSSDVANRLIGWTLGDKTCKETTVGEDA